MSTSTHIYLFILNKLLKKVKQFDQVYTVIKCRSGTRLVLKPEYLTTLPNCLIFYTSLLSSTTFTKGLSA